MKKKKIKDFEIPLLFNYIPKLVIVYMHSSEAIK